MLHGCYFCWTLKSATVEEEIAFFDSKLDARSVFLQLLALRERYEPSFVFILRCFKPLIQLYYLTVKENKFPIAVKNPA